MNKPRHFILCILFCYCILSAYGSGTEGVRATNWRYVAGERPETALDGSFPLVVRDGGSRGGGISLISDFTVPHGREGPLGIILFKNNMACKVFVNDVFIESMGKPGPDFFFQPYISRGVLVPESVLRETNVLRLELWNDTGSYKLRMIQFADDGAYRVSMNRYNFLDVQLPRFACVLLMFVAVYCLFFFVNYTERREILSLSLASLLFSIYLLNVSVFDSTVPYLVLKASLYACFPLSIMFIFHFFRKFFQIRTGRRALWAVSLVGVVFALGYFFQPSTAALDGWHSIMLVYPVGVIVYGAVGVVRCLKAGKLETIPTMLGLLVTIVFSGYDIYYFIADLTPMILLQGIGFMSLIVGTFYNFSQEIALANRKCALYASEMQKGKEIRDRLFQQIKQDAIKSEESSLILGESVERVGSLVTQYLASIGSINMNIESQSEQVSRNKDCVERIFSAIQETSGMVSQHEELVGVTVQNVQELTDGIHRTDRLVRASGDTLQKLNAVCLAADRDVSESLKFVDDLASYSDNINEIVKSISDLAEQTNILSINAAIEAARSGQMGKGFAVVADEIRSLASRSGDSANQIKTILGTMVAKIRTIQRQETLVSGRLKDIVGENKVIDGSISEIFKVLEGLLERNERISSTVQNLVTAVRRITEQTEEEKLSGGDLRDSLVLLESITSSILTASREQESCNEELKANLGKLSEVSRNNRDVVMDLKELIV